MLDQTIRDFCEERHKDELMGCYDFLGFKIMAEEIIRSNPETEFNVWYCDVKQFKYINNSFGFETGDKLLHELGEVLRTVSGTYEIAGRIYGDHFVLLTFCKPLEVHKTEYLQLIKALNDRMTEDVSGTHIDISSGCYTLRPQDYVDVNVSRYIDFASVAQKEAKKRKGSRFEFFSEDAWRKETRAVEISRHLKSAIERGEIETWFQPQFNFTTSKMIGAEVLCRWNHPQYGWIMPGEFISVLEETGQISELDQFIWEESCKHIKRWLNQGVRIPLAVNISRKDILETELVEHMTTLTRKYQIEPELLRLEITESAYMDEAEKLQGIVNELREKGFLVEMDDFGSGYSSLNMLKEVPVSLLKLDLRFLSGENNEKGSTVIGAVLNMAHGMDMPVIAEGVETIQQADYLKNLGCSLMQGYFFAKPMPLIEFERQYLHAEVGGMPQNFAGYSTDLIRELIRTDSSSSFIFNRCIGPAALLEYSGEVLHTLAYNEDFYNIMFGEQYIKNHYAPNLFEEIQGPDLEMMKEVIEDVLQYGETSTTIKLEKEGRWLKANYRLIHEADGLAMIFCEVENISRERYLENAIKDLKWQQKKYEIIAHMPGVITYDYDVEEDVYSMDICNENGEVKTVVAENYSKTFDDSSWIYATEGPGAKDMFEASLNKPVAGQFDFKANLNGKEELWYRSNYYSVTDEDGKVYRVVGRIDCIDMDVKKSIGWREQSQQDVMTKLMHHDAIIKRIEKEIKLSKGGTVFMIDLDDFKKINDEQGHLFGDEVIKKVASTLRRVFRSTDLLGRFGGDEFIAFLPSSYDEKGIAKRAERLLEVLNTIAISDTEFLKVSIGIATDSTGRIKGSELLHRADEALYQAKNSGKNTMVLLKNE